MSCGALAERSPGTAAALRYSRSGRLLGWVPRGFRVSAPPFGGPQPRRGSAGINEGP